MTLGLNARHITPPLRGGVFYLNYSRHAIYRTPFKGKMKNLHSVSHVAAAIGLTHVTLLKYISLKIISEGGSKLNNRMVWSDEDLAKCIEEKKLFDQYHVSGNIAAILGVNLSRMRAKFVPDLIMEKKYYYHQDRIPQMREEIKASRVGADGLLVSGSRSRAIRRREAGIFTLSDIAKAADVVRVSLDHHIKTGFFPEPAVSAEFGCKYFTKKQMKEILAFYKKTKASRVPYQNGKGKSRTNSKPIGGK